jgi:DNA-binding MarR family transcriptional regulator
VAELERLGYVLRLPDPQDGRAKIIKLTERGREACLAGDRLLAEIEREWADELGEEAVAALRSVAERIAGLEVPAPPDTQRAA